MSKWPPVKWSEQNWGGDKSQSSKAYYEDQSKEEDGGEPIKKMFIKYHLANINLWPAGEAAAQERLSNFLQSKADLYSEG